MKRTWAVIVVSAVLLGLYDIYTFYFNGSETTISWVLYSYSTQYPAIPFGFGFLMGHIFASMRGIPVDDNKKTS